MTTYALTIEDAPRAEDVAALAEGLILALEQAARERGCTHAHLDTFSFQARPFYEKLGYELFPVDLAQATGRRCGSAPWH